MGGGRQLGYAAALPHVRAARLAYLEGMETKMKPASPASIGFRCGDIADIVFPHNMDRAKRDKLALALVELARVIRDSDRSAEAGETGTGSTEGESAGPQDIAQPSSNQGSPS